VKKIISLAMLSLSLLVIAFAVVPAHAAERCDNCKMKVADDSGYQVQVKFKDGTSKLECSIFCASMEKERAPGKVESLVVRDFLTGETLDAIDAVWVAGSDAKKMMSDESRIAFKDRAEAEKYISEHGGRVLTFDEAYKETVDEWRGL